MAGTVTLAETPYTRPPKLAGVVQKLRFAWTSDSNGDADKASIEAYTGKIVAVTTDPDGTDVPTASYDITLTDAHGEDVLFGAAGNRHESNTEHIKNADLGAVANSILTLNVSNAGNAKKGVIAIWIR